jgi:hypothetical protein
MRNIMSLWPTVKDMSDDLGLPYTTVHSWWQRGRIPHAHDFDIIRAAATRGHSLTHEQLAQARLAPVDGDSGLTRDMRIGSRENAGAA